MITLELEQTEVGFKVDINSGKSTIIIPKVESFNPEQVTNIIGNFINQVCLFSITSGFPKEDIIAALEREWDKLKKEVKNIRKEETEVEENGESNNL
jgi:hypothetical protein